MKFYHLIYNSSEKGVSGSYGFGIRSITENAPADLGQLLTDNQLFRFKYINAGKLTPSVISSNPESIKQVPPTYTFSALTSSNKEQYFVLGRKIAVGFDFSFYKEGKPTRLGNYVGDFYIFKNSVPTDLFEMLYENPAEDSCHFIPTSPVPNVENDEMKEISLGHMPTIPEEDKSFKAASLPEISDDALELLFAYAESKVAGKPVLFKMPAANTNKVVADFFRLLPESEYPNATFFTNYDTDGKEKGYNIFVINEFFPFEIFKNQYVFVDRIAGLTVTTKERDLFLQHIKSDLAKGDFKSIKNRVKWMLSAEFNAVKELSIATNEQVYNYTIEPDSFDLTTPAKNSELLGVLAKFCKENSSKQTLLNNYVQKRLDDCNCPKDILETVDYCNALKGIDFSQIIENPANKQHITDIVLVSPETFVETLNLCGGNDLKKIEKFLNLSMFASKDYFLSQPEIKPVWDKAYKYLLNKVSLETFIVRTIDEGLPVAMREKVVAEYAENNFDNIFKALMQLINANTHENICREYMEGLTSKQILAHDVYNTLSSKKQDPAYAKLFFWQIKKLSANAKDNIKNKIALLTGLTENDGFIDIVSNDKTAKSVYNEFFEALKGIVTGNIANYAAVSDLIASVLASFDGKLSPMKQSILKDWIVLSNVVNQCADDEELGDEDSLKNTINMAFEVKDKNYLRTKLLPFFIKDKRSKPKDFAGRLLKENIITTDELFNLAKKSPDCKKYWHVYFVEVPMKGKQIIEKLQIEGNISEKEAEQFLQKYFPDVYNKYKNPGIIGKISEFFNSLFGKKEKKPTKQEENAKAKKESLKKH